MRPLVVELQRLYEDANIYRNGNVFRASQLHNQVGGEPTIYNMETLHAPSSKYQRVCSLGSRARFILVPT